LSYTSYSIGGDIKNNFESLSIKKNNFGTYNLYGLMWWEFTQNGKPTKSLVSVNSNNLRWDYKTTIEENFDHTYIRSGNGGILGSFLSSLTRKILYNFSFSNIMSDDVLVTLTILNEGMDGFMRYNTYEGLDNYTVKINVAGVKKDEIRVILEDGIIKVRTNPKAQPIEDVDTKLEMFEPIKGDAEIYLPNIESVEAKLEDGILILTAPKESKGVKIDIK
jgi:HSP20 family molecular chaperone IbpA